MSILPFPKSVKIKMVADSYFCSWELAENGFSPLYEIVHKDGEPFIELYSPADPGCERLRAYCKKRGWLIEC